MLKIGGQKIPFLTVLLIGTEAVLLTAGLCLATVVRLHTASMWEPITNSASLGRFVLVVAVCVLCLYYYDLYDLQVVSRRSILFIGLLQSFGIACLILAVIYYVNPGLSLGRGVAVLAAPVVLVLIFGWRLAVQFASRYIVRAERVLVLGLGDAGLALVGQYAVHPELNIDVLGFLDEDVPASRPRAAAASAGVAGGGIAALVASGETSRAVAVADAAVADVMGATLARATIVGAMSELQKVVEREKIDRLVISLTERRGRMPVRELLKLKFAGVVIEDAYSAFERVTGRILLEHLNPSYLIMSDGFAKSMWLAAAKRALDVVASLLAITITTPLMLLVAAAIWLEDGAPMLFRQKRVGLHGREFEILKFRSMYVTPPNAPPSWTVKTGDKRITRVGTIIRKTRLDELPQFFNVLRGDMSLVGPRPEQPYFCQMLEEQIPYYGQRHSVRPGITGWAQVKYGYGASIEETKVKLEHDLFYIKHMSVALDLAIMFETAKVMLSNRGAA